MKELLLVYEELDKEKDSIIRCNENLKKEMDEMARMIPVDYEDKIKEDYLKKENIYNSNKEALKDIEKKITIINEAMDILEGVGV